jgi:hypothetical protein
MRSRLAPAAFMSLTVALIGMLAVPSSPPYRAVHHLIVDKLINGNAYRLISIDIAKDLCAPNLGNAPDYCKSDTRLEQFADSAAALRQPVDEMIAKLPGASASPGVVGDLHFRIRAAEDRGEQYFTFSIAMLSVLSTVLATLTGLSRPDAPRAPRTRVRGPHD